MRGEIADYKESLRRRVALLQGVPASDLQRVYDERLRFNPGAEALVAACRAAGLKTLLVSGGFTFFTDRVRERLGIDFARSNVLGIEKRAAHRRMVDQPWGDICDGDEKKRMLLDVGAALGIAPARAIAVGDGANDLPMMSVAGLSVAYHAKPKVRAAANGGDRQRRPRPAARAVRRRPQARRLTAARDVQSPPIDAPPDFLADRQRRRQPRRLDAEQLHHARRQPCSAGPAMRKSAGGRAGPESLGRTPRVGRQQRVVGAGPASSGGCRRRRPAPGARRPRSRWLGSASASHSTSGPKRAWPARSRVRCTPRPPSLGVG